MIRKRQITKTSTRQVYVVNNQEGWMVIVEREAVMRVHQRYQWEEKRITLTQEELCKITKATQEV